MNGPDLTPRTRKPRSDGLRNRARVLEAAKAVFTAGGPAPNLEAVARQAGVGIGTLYRHFPTREALFEAVYVSEVEHMVALEAELAAHFTPLEALRRWLHAQVEFVARKRGMSTALAVAMHASSNLTAHATGRLCGALQRLLGRAAETGAIRGDIGAEEIVRTVVGLCYTHDMPGWERNVIRLVDVFIDGMRRP